MKRALLSVAVLAAVAVVIAAILIVPMMRSGLSTHEEPSGIEATLARMVRHQAVPAELRDAKNPMPLTPAELAEMEKLNPRSPAEFEAMQAEEEFLSGAASSTTSHETAPAHHH